MRKGVAPKTATRNGSYLWSGRVNQADICLMTRTPRMRSIWATTRTAVSISKRSACRMRKVAT